MPGYPGCSTGTTLDPTGMCSSVGGVQSKPSCPAGAPNISTTSHMCSVPITYTWLPWLAIYEECDGYFADWNNTTCVFTSIQLDTDDNGAYDVNLSNSPAGTPSITFGATPGSNGAILNIMSTYATNLMDGYQTTYSIPSSNIQVQASDSTVPVPFDLSSCTSYIDIPMWSNNVFWGACVKESTGLLGITSSSVSAFYGIRYDELSPPGCPARYYAESRRWHVRGRSCVWDRFGRNTMLFDPTSNMCVDYAKLCPLNTASTQYACIDNGTGDLQCSPNACVDLNATAPIITSVTPTYLTNDGTVSNSTGSCAGQLYIFSGRPLQCKIGGVQTNYFDCCDPGPDYITLIEAGLVSGGIVYGTMATEFLIGSVNSSQSCSAINSLLNLNNCSPDSALVVDAVNNKASHYIGEYCVDQWPIIGCVQQSKMYCVFSSELARVIAEQGRPQLTDFGSDGGWGTATSPNCRGFTPQEFQMLDFSKMNLSEWINDMTTTSIPQVQQNVTTNINNFYNNVTGSH